MERNATPDSKKSDYKSHKSGVANAARFHFAFCNFCGSHVKPNILIMIWPPQGTGPPGTISRNTVLKPLLCLTGCMSCPNVIFIFDKWQQCDLLYFTAGTTSTERAEQLTEWLKNYSQPRTQVEAYIRNTVHYRAGWIRADHFTGMVCKNCVYYRAERWRHRGHMIWFQKWKSNAFFP